MFEEKQIAPLQRISLALDLDSAKVEDVTALGSALHGALIEQLASLDGPYVSTIHDQHDTPRPFTQAIRFRGKDLEWQITTLNTAFASRLQSWLGRLPTKLPLRRFDLVALPRSLPAQEPACHYQDLVRIHLTELPPPRRISLNFYTPTAFRSAADRNDILFPLPRLLWQSALRKWEIFCQDYRLEQPGLIEDLASLSIVSQYRLQTLRVALGSTSRLDLWARCRLHCAAPKKRDGS
ncbi:MAG: hypothetical protein HY692_09850 [Cyanobacteria bacterium NC_groundwater_1444_Ag_S-0.65um_54_12]|nr:hypothetical protein [Cyanobacteria bacterium NC_groundwater_1444_Ag_S-0.65um_54_12]